MEDAFANIQLGGMTRTCKRYDKLKELRESFGPKPYWDDLMQLTFVDDSFVSFFTLASYENSRWLEYYKCFRNEDKEDEVDEHWSAAVFFQPKDTVIVEVTKYTRDVDSERAYNASLYVLLVDPDILKRLGVDKETIRKQFEYVYELLSCNRENVAMLESFLSSYAGDDRQESFSEEFDTVEEFHSYCDNYLGDDYHKELYDCCLKRIDS